jgi:hypothetical protein
MINGLIIGIGSILVLGILVSLFEEESRQVYAAALFTLLVTPVIPLYVGLRKIMDSHFQGRVIDNEVLARFVRTSAFGAVIVRRRGRAYLVLTDTAKWRGSKEESKPRHALREAA